MPDAPVRWPTAASLLRTLQTRPRPCSRCLLATSLSPEKNAPRRFAGGHWIEDTLQALTATPQADGRRPGLPMESAADAGAHRPRATTQLVTVP